MKLMRLIYFLYYLKQLDKEKFHKFLNYTHKQTGKSKMKILIDLFRDSLKYNISILEYFQFRFFEITDEVKKQWAGTGYMYEYQLVMNPKNKRDILDDKRLFFKKYNQFFIHNVADLKELKSNPEIFNLFKNTPSQKMVFKVSDGKCGVGVKIEPVSKFQFVQDVIQYMKEHSMDLVEEFIIQHDDLNRLSPSAVNTVRIFTQLTDENKVEILGCRQRISINNSVDNLAAGNVAAPIDEESGIINGKAIYGDITKEPIGTHPVTGVKIEGFQVPFWKECLQLAKEAALAHPQNRSIGWDIVVTNEGPGLIEGNHDWCKLVWQLPVAKGLKNMVVKHV